MTVRAWPTPDPAKIAVEEFAPGTSAHFVSGRLTTDNGKPGIRIRPDKVVEENGKFYLDSEPADYWMLCKALPGTLEMGHGQKHAFTGNIVPATGPNPTGRIMVYGHVNSDGSVAAKGAVATPGTPVESGIPFERSPMKLLTAFPMTPTERPVDEGEFGL